MQLLDDLRGGSRFAPTPVFLPGRFAACMEFRLHASILDGVTHGCLDKFRQSFSLAKHRFEIGAQFGFNAYLRDD